MRTIVVASAKGGTGKTTIAVNLAVEYARAGFQVALVDADPQGAAMAWAGVRGANDMAAVAVQAAALPAVLAEAREDAYDAVIVDTPSHALPTLHIALKCATVALLPFQPSWFDLWTLPALMQTVRTAGSPAMAVLSVAPTQLGEIATARNALMAGGLDTFRTVIHARAPFRRAWGLGQAVCEVDPGGAAACEMDNLRREIDSIVFRVRRQSGGKISARAAVHCKVATPATNTATSVTMQGDAHDSY